ncbi:MAG TPA: hypothetical protein VMJ92_00775 [Candidatus Limnocylindrales bacterium]|nr:hypothetical protein [Candidatus Limnocylindrales bacterium]
MRLVGGLLGSLLTLAVLGGAGLFVLSQQQPRVAEGLPAVLASETAARSFDEKITALDAAVEEARRSGAAREVTLALTEEELTSKARELTRIGDGSAVATDTQIRLRDGRIIATSLVTLQGLTRNRGIVAITVVEDGRTKIVISEIQTGALPLPEAVTTELNKQIGASIDPVTLGLPLDVSDVTVADGTIVVTGTARP